MRLANTVRPDAGATRQDFAAGSDDAGLARSPLRCGSGLWRLRRAALATSMRHYRTLLLKVARELEAKAAALEIDAEKWVH